MNKTKLEEARENVAAALNYFINGDRAMTFIMLFDARLELEYLTTSDLEVEFAKECRRILDLLDSGGSFNEIKGGLTALAIGLLLSTVG